MENVVDYQSLYAIQDRVLAAVFSGQTEFYLTGPVRGEAD